MSSIRTAPSKVRSWPASAPRPSAVIAAGTAFHAKGINDPKPSVKVAARMSRGT